MAKKKQDGETLHGSNKFEATYQIGDETVQLGDLVVAAFQRSGLTREEWDGLDDGVRDAHIETELQRRQKDGGVGPDQNTNAPAATASTPQSNEGQTVEPGAFSVDEKEQAAELLDKATKANGPVATLRAFNQEDEARYVEELMAEKTKADERVKELEDKDAEYRGKIAKYEQAHNEMARRIKSLEEQATRGPALHGRVDDLKTPY